MLINNQEHLVNFELLSDFTANNPVFEKQLIAALLNDLELFKMAVYQQPDEEKFLNFRKACHNIYPSLNMLQINELIVAIEEYKTAYADKQDSIPFFAEKIHRILDRVLLEAVHWLGS
jgi:hypothetical protein